MAQIVYVPFPLPKPIAQQLIKVAPGVLRPSSLSSSASLRLSLTSSGSSLRTQFSKHGLVFKYTTVLCFPLYWELQVVKTAFQRTESICSNRPPCCPNCTFQVSHPWRWTQPHEDPGTVSRASTTRKSHLLWNRNSREKAFSGKCDENRKQESKSPVSTFHRQSF